jgi:hypothetical protein
MCDAQEIHDLCLDKRDSRPGLNQKNTKSITIT